MFENILAFSIEFVVQTVFLTVGLWIMIKIQKLDYNFLGLLGSAALASGLETILDTTLDHFFGIYLSSSISTPIVGTVLYVCIVKVTRADSVDVVFTIAVGYALMFGMNLWLLGSLMGDLRPSARDDLEGENDAIEMGVESQAATETNETLALVQATNKAQGRPAPASTDPASKPKEPGAAELTREIAKIFSLKGVIQSANKPMATIYTGVKTYTIAVGETLSMETAKGKTPVRCEGVGENLVVLTVAGERVTLFLW